MHAYKFPQILSWNILLKFITPNRIGKVPIQINWFDYKTMTLPFPKQISNWWNVITSNRKLNVSEFQSIWIVTIRLHCRVFFFHRNSMRWQPFIQLYMKKLVIHINFVHMKIALKCSCHALLIDPFRYLWKFVHYGGFRGINIVKWLLIELTFVISQTYHDLLYFSLQK